MKKRVSPQVTITLQPEILERLENFRWSNRIASRSAAVALLVEIGLACVDDGNRDGYSPTGGRDSCRD